MITNERQYRNAESEGKKFERAIAAARAEKPRAEVHPRSHKAMIESLESELEILRKQLHRYESKVASPQDSRNESSRSA